MDQVAVDRRCHCRDCSRSANATVFRCQRAGRSGKARRDYPRPEVSAYQHGCGAFIIASDERADRQAAPAECLHDGAAHAADAAHAIKHRAASLRVHFRVLKPALSNSKLMSETPGGRPGRSGLPRQPGWTE